MKMIKNVIARDERLYLAWPDLVQTASGRLICAFSACTSHGDRGFTQIWLSDSEDGGRTWSASRPIGKACGTKVGYYYNNVSLAVLTDGRLVMACDRIDGDDENRSDSTIMLAFSSDEGRTWSDFVDTPAKGIVPDKVFVTSTGRWLLACHYYDSTIEALVQRLWYSDDEGKTWNGPVVVAREQNLNLCEASIIQIEDTLIAFMRENSGLGLPVYRSYSRDNGETWSSVSQFALPGCHRPKVGKLSDGRYMITYRFSAGGSNPFANVMLGVTDAASILNPEYTCGRVKIYPLDVDSNRYPDTGYTGWVEKQDGHLYIVNYIRDDWPRGQIRGYDIERLPLEDINDLRL